MEERGTHAKPIDVVVREFQTDLDKGLSQEEAQAASREVRRQ